MKIQFGERDGHGGWFIGPKLFRPVAYPVCASSKLREFICFAAMKYEQLLNKLMSNVPILADGIDCKVG